VAGDVSVDLGKVIDSVKDLEMVKESDRCVALLPRAFRALFCGPEMWMIRQEHKVRVLAAELEQELLKIDVRKIAEPPMYVAVPALQAVSYSMDSDELRSMYVKLLARAMNTDTADSVHPAFVETIKQLSPFDALMLKSITQNSSNPFINIWKRDSDGSGTIVFNYFSTYSVNLDNPLLASTSLSNLERLGLVHVDNDLTYHDEKFLYEKLIDSDFIRNIVAENDRRVKRSGKKKTIDFDKGCIEITPFGKSFVEICLTD